MEEDDDDVDDDDIGILCIGSLSICSMYLNVWKFVPKKLFIIPTVVVSTTKSLLGVANTEYIRREEEGDEAEEKRERKYVMTFSAEAVGS